MAYSLSAKPEHKRTKEEDGANFPSRGALGSMRLHMSILKNNACAACDGRQERHFINVASTNSCFTQSQIFKFGAQVSMKTIAYHS